MAFKGIAEANQRRLDEHVRKEIQELAKRGNITLAELEEFRGNSWEHEHIVPVLDDEAFLKHAEHMLNNCRFDNSRPYRSYNEAVMGMMMPELIKRFGVLLRTHARSQEPSV